MTMTIELPDNFESVLEKAAKEGWSIFDCDGSDNGPWQIQGFDCPSDWIGIAGFEPPCLTDNDAWLIVMKGEEEHHRIAREFIKQANPVEYKAMAAYCERT